MTTDDPLWAAFAPLWQDLRGGTGGRPMLVAGGYGLFLKQRWRFEDPARRTVVRAEDWLDPAPRVTRDLDLVIGLDLLASADAQAGIVGAMEQNQFRVVERNPRWQFERTIEEGRRVLVELHAEMPSPGHAHLAVDKRLRVKHKPSLGARGVHGRQNPEAAGGELHPFEFRVGGVEVAVPNPVTWSVMKLVAMRDRWRKAQEPERPEAERERDRQQAIKHAGDVTRVVALTTREEQDRAAEVVGIIRREPCFASAVEACAAHFGNDDGWGGSVARRMWRAEDMRVIKSVLTDWFR